jgi:uncharacterized protein (DUF2249 family)
VLVSPDTLRAPVLATDRVSAVLARDEALVEVFVRHAPQFDKLRNRAMRSVMARLVTVEQAARVGGASVELLLRDLNDALGTASAPPVTAPSPERPMIAPLRPAHGETVEVDVREDLRSGREPFSRIMAAVNALRAGQVLLIRAIFEPVPLFAALAKRGFVHAAHQAGPEDWSIWFWRPEDSPTTSPATGALPPAAAGAPDGMAGDDTTVWLDVRGLEPPEPLMRTLTALEALPDGRQLVQVNVRVPQLLLPMLAERGFACEVDESRADQVLVRIWRPGRA